MVSDLPKILQAIQSAQSDEEKRRLETELLEAVRAHIRELYDDPRYPRRRRTFGAIRKSLQIYNDKEGDLRDALFGMGARAVKGDGEEALWELPKELSNEPPDDPPPTQWSKTYAMLCGLILLAAAGGWYLDLVGPSEPVICNLDELNLEELKICEENHGVVE